MKRPSLATFLFGNLASCFAILIIGGFLIYEWWIGQVHVLVAVGALSAILNAAAANDRLNKYNHWKRAWDGMSGEPRRNRGRVLRGFAGIVGWAIFAALATQLDRRDPANQVAIGLFALGSAGLILIGLRRVWKRAIPGQRRPRRIKDVPVTISLPVPRDSPDRRQIYQGLPDYCARLE
jgi:hypothetical protein